MTTNPTITQADREAVAEHARNKWSGEDIYTSFARHREQAVAEKDAEIAHCKAAITEANNSLFGSQSYFLSFNGDEPDKYHLARPIEELKGLARKSSILGLENARLREVLAKIAGNNWRDQSRARFVARQALQPKEQDDDE